MILNLGGKSCLETTSQSLSLTISASDEILSLSIDSIPSPDRDLESSHRQRSRSGLRSGLARKYINQRKYVSCYLRFPGNSGGFSTLKSKINNTLDGF